MSDLTAKARIRDAALAVIAERGSGGASVRAIADRAGVSPALVLHHYGSKQGVYDEVAHWALTAISAATHDVGDGTDPAEAHLRRQAAMDELLDDQPVLSAYLGQLLRDGSPEGLRWFRDAVHITSGDLRQRAADGLARPSGDFDAAAAMLLIVSMAPVLLRPLLDGALGTDVSTAAGRRRWRQAESEMLTSALYPPSP